MSDRRDDDAAIVGMSCLFPSAADVDAYWNNILGSVDAISDPPPGSWDTSIYYDPDITEDEVATTDKVYCKRGGYLGPLASFNPLRHGVPPISVGGEPDQWLALQLARDAMVDAGCEQLPEHIRRRTAVILGKGTYLNGGNATVLMHSLLVGQTLAIIKSLHAEYTDEQMEHLRIEMKRSLPRLGPEMVPGLVPNVIVGRIANRLDLMGPTYTVDAACASSLVAVDLALRDLRSGACDLALVGGSQVWIPVPTLNIFCQLSALSRRQQIRPFDKDADGTLLGEGIGMLVLKRLADAERDGDRIYAVVKGVGVASDGRAVGVMAPRVEGEELALRRAYEAADVDPRTVGLIEAHGTGTPVGDAVELESLRRVFGSRDGPLPWCALGSVKSMISHTMPAAGVAGMIKTALALHHRVLPPTLNCSEPNPRLELEKSPFYLNTQTRPWIHAGPEPRRAGVNAFGFGGINAHVVLEEYTEPRSVAPRRSSHEPQTDHAPDWDSEVVILEAESPTALHAAAEELLEFLRASVSAEDESARAPFRLLDVAASINADIGRIGEPYRLAIIASEVADLRTKLERAVRKLADPNCRQIKDVAGIYYFSQPLARTGKLAFLFPGEGSQYTNMLADLCLRLPEVRQRFDLADRMFQEHPRAHVLSDYVFPRPAFSEAERAWANRRLSHLDGAVESVLTANDALLVVLQKLDVKADAIVGHSTGEFSAMIAAGIIVHTEQGMTDVTLKLNRSYESAAASDQVPRAVLLAVGAERAEVERIAREAGGDVYVAMDNCPHQTVLVGQPDAVERALDIVKREGLIYEHLTFDRAYHTPLFAPYTDHLRRIFDEVPLFEPHTPVFSCTTSSPYPTEAREVRKLMVDHWVKPVEFSRTIQTLYAQGTRLFVEVGPRGNLSAFVQDILRGKPFCAVPANVQRRSGISQINHLAGLLAAHGVGLKLEYLYERRSPRRVAWHDGAPAPQRTGVDAIALSTAQPVMRMPPDILEQLAELSGGRPSDESPPPAPTAEPTFQTAAARESSEPVDGAAPERRPVSMPSTGQPPSALLPARPAARAVTGTESSSQGSAMRAYLHSMDSFLATQQDVMGAYLGHLSASVRFPLLGWPVRQRPGLELVAERTLRLSDDLYLRDHTLGGAVSRTDPALYALALMPLTMSLEILAEAAAYLEPGKIVVGLRDVVAYRWLTWDDRPQVLRTSARMLDAHADGTAVRVQLRNLTEDAQSGEAPRSPAIEATVILADRYAPDAATPPRVLAHGRPSRWRPEQLYSKVMFHGPTWRGVTAIQATGPNGIIARLKSLPFDAMLRGISRPRFELDPITLDAAGQLIGFWTAEHLATGAVVFPFRLARLDVFGPQRRAGEDLTCSAAVELSGNEQIRSNIDVFDANGRRWLRLEGWEDKRFVLPPAFETIVQAGAEAETSERWPEPLVALGPIGAIECRRITRLPEANRGFWARIWAQRILSRAERRAFEKTPSSEVDRFIWLAGRAAAKDAVRFLLRTQAGIDLLSADISIAVDGQGGVTADGPWRRMLGTPLTVSLASERDYAIALAALGSQVRPGVAVVNAGGLATGQALSAAEELVLAGVPHEQRHEWRLRVLAATVAAANATGAHGAQAIGLHSGTGIVRVRVASTVHEVVTVQDGSCLVAFATDRPSQAQPGGQNALSGAATANPTGG